MSYHRIFTLLLLYLSIAMPVFGSNDATPSRNPNFYDDPNTCIGWFCYEDPLDYPRETNQEKPSATIFNGDIDWDQVWTLPPEDLKRLINDTLSWAQQSPEDEKRMLTYLSLQGVAMRRAKAFQEAWSAAILKYPVLDEGVQRSPTTAATNLEIIAERHDREKIISQMREHMGLIPVSYTHLTLPTKA